MSTITTTTVIHTLTCELCGAEHTETLDYEGARGTWPSGWHAYAVVFGSEAKQQVDVCAECVSTRSIADLTEALRAAPLSRIHEDED